MGLMVEGCRLEKAELRERMAVSFYAVKVKVFGSSTISVEYRFGIW
jgi:hypothetical protein